MVLFHSLNPTSYRSSQSILDGPVGARSSSVLGTMLHIISLRNSFLLAMHAIALGTVMLRHLVVRFFVVSENTSPCLLLPRCPNGSVAVRMRVRSNRINLIDLGYFHFPIIFDLNYGKEVTPIFMGQGTISLLIILQLILHR